VSRSRSRLGRGLDALLPRSEGGERLVRVPLALIRPSPLQPRARFSEEGLKELADSIRQKGLLQPLLIRPKGDGYELVAGERRFRAAQMAGLSEVPAVVREMDDRAALEVALVENLQREDLSPVEEARGYRRLVEMGLSHQEIAERVGRSRSAVTNALRLLQLPDEVLAALDEGRISAGHARALLALPPDRRLWGLAEILTKGLNVRQAEALAERAARPRRRREAHPELARALEERLGVRVRITGRRRGRVELFYSSEEELEGILELLGGGDSG